MLNTPGADINAKTPFGYSVLHYAVGTNETFKATESLTKSKIDINAKEIDQGNTLLHLAAANVPLESVKLLAACSTIKPNKINNAGNTALHAAVYVNQNAVKTAEHLASIVKLDPFAVNNGEFDVFTLVVARNRGDVLKVLLELVNPQKDKVFPGLTTAYFYAVQANKNSVAQLFTEYMPLIASLIIPKSSLTKRN